MSRWSPVLLFLLLFSFWPASASAQNPLAPPKVYFAVVGTARDARQQTLIMGLVDDVRRDLRTPAITAEKVDELRKWTAADAPNLVPKQFNRYVVASMEEKYQIGLGMATFVIFEMGRLESTSTGPKLASTDVTEGMEIIVAPAPSDEQLPAQFKKFIGGSWRSRPNSLIASEVTLWIKSMLPELQHGN